MNARDSEKLAGILEGMGYTEVDTEEADVVFINTCTIRESANERVYGHLGQLKNMKKKNPNMFIGICGCMMQEPDEIERIRKSYRFVNLVFGTYNIYKVPVLFKQAMETGKQVIDVAEEISDQNDSMPVKRVFQYKSGVNIMYGCDNFCSYCIVPYVRGRERSREPEDIIREIEHLVDDGVIEIMLLGQNVNSYGRGLKNPISFAQLLRQICRIDGVQRVRFMTSHPKDLSDELIQTIAEEPKVCHHFHLPLQSGSTEILTQMNRRYTKEIYLERARKLREAVPDISITTDIIVGFPGETDEDFEDTMDVVRQVQYESAFTFIYSKRTGTRAAEMENQVPPEIVKERFDRLLELVQVIAKERTQRHVGKVMSALIEEVDEQQEGWVSGRLSNNMMVHLKGDPSMIGTIVDVKLEEAKGFYYYGTQV